MKEGRKIKALNNMVMVATLMLGILLSIVTWFFFKITPGWSVFIGFLVAVIAAFCCYPISFDSF